LREIIRNKECVKKLLERLQEGKMRGRELLRKIARRKECGSESVRMKAGEREMKKREEWR
jgi:hypothetical protein